MARYLAIDADVHGVIIASGNTRGHNFKVEQTVVLPEEHQGLSPATAKALGKRIQEAMKHASIAPAPVLLCVGRDRVVLKDIKHPPTSAGDEPAVVRFQTLKELADSPDDLIIDYISVGKPDSTTGERRALVATFRREMLAAAKVMCENAGLKLAGVTPRPFAAAADAHRAMAIGIAPPLESADDTFAALFLTERGGEFTVVRQNQVRFTRTVPVGAVASEATLIAEIRRNMTVYSAQSGSDEVRAIYLSEAGTGALGWAGRLQAALPVPVYAYDPLSGESSAERIPADLRGRFASPLGLLAARAIGDLPINFSQPRQPRAESDPKKSRQMIALLCGIMLLFGLGMLGYFLVDSAATTTKNLQARVRLKDDELKRLEPEMKRLDAVEDYLAREVNWLDELYDLTERSPDINKMRVIAFKGKSLPMPNEKERQQQAKDALANKNAPKKPIAKLEMELIAPNGELPNKFVASLDQRYYPGSRPIMAAIVPGGNDKNKMQQARIETGIVHRGPTEYTRKLSTVMPKVIEPETDKKKNTENAAAEGDSP